MCFAFNKEDPDGTIRRFSERYSRRRADHLDWFSVKRSATMPRPEPMLAEERRQKVREIIEEKGRITVEDIVTRFHVSAVTARSDLEFSKSLAVRANGGIGFDSRGQIGEVGGR